MFSQFVDIIKEWINKIHRYINDESYIEVNDEVNNDETDIVISVEYISGKILSRRFSISKQESLESIRFRIHILLPIDLLTDEYYDINGHKFFYKNVEITEYNFKMFSEYVLKSGQTIIIYPEVIYKIKELNYEKYNILLEDQIKAMNDDDFLTKLYVEKITSLLDFVSNMELRKNKALVLYHMFDLLSYNIGVTFLNQHLKFKMAVHNKIIKFITVDNIMFSHKNEIINLHDKFKEYLEKLFGTNIICDCITKYKRVEDIRNDETIKKYIINKYYELDKDENIKEYFEFLYDVDDINSM